MSVVKKGASALGKLFVLIALAATFIVGMVGVVYMSLQGEEIKVPEIVGKDLNQSEQELAALGLQIKKRASRPSAEKMNTILEQLPKAGETVKTGQKILVVVSEAGVSGEDLPATIKKTGDDEDDTEKIEELISDKPKKSGKTNQNTNTNKKKTSTTRDVINGNSNAANSNSSNANSNSTAAANSSNGNKSNSNGSNKTISPTETKKPASDAKPATTKPPSSGDVRPRKTP
jgi:hypothetical protein